MTNHVCRTCGRDIVRRLVGGMTTWGHATNPGPNHHYASPVAASTTANHGSPSPGPSPVGSPLPTRQLAGRAGHRASGYGKPAGRP